jgi:uncharacterized oligopeptide transporter (OPT) family protein
MHPPSAAPSAPPDDIKRPNLLEVPEDDRDRVWYETYYQGDTVPQLTVRAVLMGMVLGGVMSLSNLYVGLKTGWGLGVAITACILSYATWNTFLKLGLAKTQMSVLENNCMQSTASSAGYSTGGTIVSAIAAYLLITGENMPFGVLFCWTAFLALLGVSIAVPMKRQMINREQLTFPSGVAAAETLRSLHAAGGEAMLKARALFVTMGMGAVIKWFVEGNAPFMARLASRAQELGWFKGAAVAPDLATFGAVTIPAEVPIPVSIQGKGAHEWGLGLPVDPIMVAGGALVGLRTSLSMALGAVLVYGVLSPTLRSHDVFNDMKRADVSAGVRDQVARIQTAVPAEHAAAAATVTAKLQALEAVPAPADPKAAAAHDAAVKQAREVAAALVTVETGLAEAATIAAAVPTTPGTPHEVMERSQKVREVAAAVAEADALVAGAVTAEPSGMHRFAASLQAKLPNGGGALWVTLLAAVGLLASLAMPRRSLALVGTMGALLLGSLLVVVGHMMESAPAQGALAKLAADGSTKHLAGALAELETAVEASRDSLGSAATAARKLATLNEGWAHIVDGHVTGGSMIRKWALWSGSAMMVTGGLTAFAFQWKSIVRAFSGLGALFQKKDSSVVDPLDAIEVPNSWFAIGTLVSGAGCVAVMHAEWGISWYWGVLSIGFAFVLSLVACRATGETDITPIGAMGKVTQLFYGVTLPQNATANLMTAGVTAGAAGSAADLLTDLKSGYLLGANPRKQTIAQMLGIIAGTFVVVPIWYVLVPNAQAIGSDSKNFPAPSAEVWASVSKLLANGLDSLHPTIRLSMMVGGVLGVVLTLAEQLAPGSLRKWLPSATGIGLACVINFSDSIAFLIGALIAWWYAKKSPEKAETYVVPVSSGIIAGESIMGIVIALAGAFGFM